MESLFDFYLKDWGWAFLSIFAGAIFVGMFIDSQIRKIPATWWLLGVFLCLVAFVPGAVYTISSDNARDSLQNHRMIIFFVGILGGMFPPIIAIGYYLAFKDYQPPPEPQPSQQVVVVQQPAVVHETLDSGAPTYLDDNMGFAPPPRGGQPAPPSQADLASAWLVNIDFPDKSYWLRKGETSFGRSAENDHMLDDPAVSKRHIVIRQDSNRFVLQDVGSSHGTLLSNIPLQTREPLSDGDIITIGNVRLRFVDGREL